MVVRLHVLPEWALPKKFIRAWTALRTGARAPGADARVRAGATHGGAQGAPEDESLPLCTKRRVLGLKARVRCGAEQ